MKLRRCSRSSILAVAFVIAAGCFCTDAQAQDDASVGGVVYEDANKNGRRDRDERGLPGVAVSNGRQVVLTNEDGEYSVSVGQDTIIFVIKPSDFRTTLDENNVSRFYYIHKPAGSPKNLKFPGVSPTGPLPEQINFPLVAQQESKKFDVLFFGDPQPRDQKEIDYIAHDVVEGLIGSGAAFGVTLGDILFDDLSLFESFNRTIGRIGIPWYNVIGNHDINFAADVDELSDETYERVYGPPYYSFNYGDVHFIVVDDVHWMSDGKRTFYRSGLSERQLDFIENDLKAVPPEQMVVAMMHIPLVKSTPWLEPRRERLLQILQQRDHCISIAGHTHHHEHVMMEEKDGWDKPTPHHHIINVTVSGAWWSGKPDENGIPHTMCVDGTPNGHSVMHFNGTNYQLDFRAARRPASFQIRITAPEVVSADRTDRVIYANVFNAMPGAEVTCRLDDGDDWMPMQKIREADPLYQALWDEEQNLKPNLNWRGLNKPMISPHLWKFAIPNDTAVGSQTIHVRAVNPNGQILTGQRIIRIE